MLEQNGCAFGFAVQQVGIIVAQVQSFNEARVGGIVVHDFVENNTLKIIVYEIRLKYLPWSK